MADRNNYKSYIFSGSSALICTECGLCFDVFADTDGIPLDRYYKCDCGSSSFTIVDGDTVKAKI